MICEVYQVNDDPDHLLLVALDGEVINGYWYIKDAERYGLKIELLGQIKYLWDKENYNGTLYRFKNGERLEMCPCCGKSKD